MQPVIHVGLSKTATTSLQDGLFSKLQGVANLGKPFIFPDGKVKQLYVPLINLNFQDALRYDATATAKAIRDIVAQADDRQVLISSEGLSYYRHNDQILVAKRLREIFGDAKILFTIREQTGWLQSLYLDDCGRFTMSSPAPAFSQWYREEIGHRNRNILDAMDYCALVLEYNSLFGASNISVLPLEMMTRKPEEFAVRLATALGQDSGEVLDLLRSLPNNNTRLSMRRYRFGLVNYYFIPAYFRRFLTRMPKSITRFLDAGPAARIQLPPDLTADLRAKYAAGNKHLSETYNLSLDEYGYTL